MSSSDILLTLTRSILFSSLFRVHSVTGLPELFLSKVRAGREEGGQRGGGVSGPVQRVPPAAGPQPPGARHDEL